MCTLMKHMHDACDTHNETINFLQQEVTKVNHTILQNLCKHISYLHPYINLKKPTLWHLFMDGVQLLQGYRGPTRRQFIARDTNSESINFLLQEVTKISNKIIFAYIHKFNKKTLLPLFMDGVQLFQGYRGTTRRQFTARDTKNESTNFLQQEVTKVNHTILQNLCKHIPYLHTYINLKKNFVDHFYRWDSTASKLQSNYGEAVYCT